MSDVTEATEDVAPGPPTDPVFTVLGVEPLEHSLTPGVRFHLHVTEPEGRDIYTIALSAQIHLDPARRTYDAATRDRLFDMFGEPERWGATTNPFQWARVEILVPSFVGSTAFTLDVPCTYDLEVASAKYFDALPGGEAALSFYFNGTVLYAGEHDRLQIVMVPWSCSASFRMPVDAWKRSIAAHFPKGGWIRLHEDTLDRLRRHKTEVGAHSYEDAVLDLLGDGSAAATNGPGSGEAKASDPLSRLGDELAALSKATPAAKPPPEKE